MSNWKEKRIDECCDILDHMRIPVNSENRQEMKGNIPYYGANGLQGYINDYIFDEELILMAEDGGNFEEFDIRPIAYKISGKSWVNNHAHILKAKTEYCQDFIFYSLVNKNIIRFITGGTRSKLNKSELVNIPLVLPTSLDTQRHIAEILTTTDTLITQTESVIAKYKSIKQGMLHDLFTRGIDVSTGKLRPTPQQAPHLYKESVLGLIPREWEVKRLEEIGVMKKGANIPKYLLAHEGIGCVIYGQLYTTFENIIKNPITKIPKQEVKGMSPLLYGDILFTGSGETHEEIGKCAVLLSNDEVYAGGDIIILTLNENQYKPYFGYLLNFEPIQKQKSKLGQGSSVIHIYSNQLGLIKLALPQKSEQELIYSKIDAVVEKIESEQLTLSKYQSIKKGLMKRLLEPEGV